MVFIKQGGTAGRFSDPVPAFKQGWGFFVSRPTPQNQKRGKL